MPLTIMDASGKTGWLGGIYAQDEWKIWPTVTLNFGARFDMEVDAFAVLVLAVTVARAAAVPPWVLAIGAMRYLYFAAGWLFPFLRQPLPFHQVGDWRRKTIAVVQSVALVVALAPATSSIWAVALCTTALGLLVYSFAADIVMLASPQRHR